MADERAKLSFVHIPKNAGTSIRRAISENSLPIPCSDHSYPAPLTDEEFVVLRSPYDRFVSAFGYERKYWPNPVNSAFRDADELASAAGDPDHPRHALAQVELGNEPGDFLQRNGKPTPVHTVASRTLRYNWIFEPQSSWLLNSPRHALDYGHLQRDFSALLSRFGLPAVALPRVNRSEEAVHALSAPARAFIERTYRADFEALAAHGIEG